MSKENNSQRTTAPLSKKKILIIDDELDLLNAVKTRLEYHNYQVFYLNSGREAVKTVQEKKPDLIILDIMIPDKDGYDICLELKKNPDTVSIPIILFTAKDEWKKDMDGLGKFVKADAYISKPFETQVLLSQIQQLLGQ